MFKKILLGLLLVTVLPGLVWFYIYYQGVSKPTRDPFEAIPQDAILIASGTDIQSTWKRFSEANMMWDDLCKGRAMEELDRELHRIDSLLSVLPDTKSLFRTNRLNLSLHSGEDNSIEFLITCSVQDEEERNVLSALLQELFQEISSTETAISGILIFEGSVVRSGRKCYWSLTDGVLVMSFSGSMLKRSLDGMVNSTHILTDPSFVKALAISGKKSDANIFIHMPRFPALYTTWLKEAYSEDPEVIPGFAEWCELDLSLKSNNLSLNGYTLRGQSGSGYLETCHDATPKEMLLPYSLPSSTVLFAYYGIEDMNSYLDNLRKFQELNKLSEDFSMVSEKWKNELGINGEGALLGWAEDEFAYGFIHSPGGETPLAFPYAVFRSADSTRSHELLSELATRLDSITGNGVDSSRFFGFPVRKIHLNNALGTLLGAPFDQIASTYFLEAHDLVFFANDPEALQSIANSIYTGRILGRSASFVSFIKDNFSPECNLFFYTSIVGSVEKYAQLLRSDLEKDLAVHSGILMNFESCGLQLTSEKGMHYTSVHLRHNRSTKNEFATVWETELDTCLSTKPFLVTNHNNGMKEVFVQDDAGTLYLISNSGKILWKKWIGGKIMGQVYQVDVYKNKKLQYLFNTRSAVHLIDRNGKDLKGFPLRPGSSITTPLTLLDYEGDLDYRILFVTENGQLRNYTINGEVAPKWTSPNAGEGIESGIMHLRIGEKDHIIACDEKGKIHFWNRRGEAHAILKEKLPANLQIFYLDKGKDLANSWLVAADSLGKIHKVSGTGKKEVLEFEGIISLTHFLYADITRDRLEEYLIVSGNKLTVFSHDKKILFQKILQGSIPSNTSVYKFPGGDHVGLFDGTENELWLFDSKGLPVSGTPLHGITPFSIGDLNREGIYNLVTGGDVRKIYVYALR